MSAVDAVALGRPAVVAAPAGTEWSGGHKYRGVRDSLATALCSRRQSEGEAMTEMLIALGLMAGVVGASRQRHAGDRGSGQVRPGQS